VVPAAVALAGAGAILASWMGLRTGRGGGAAEVATVEREQALVLQAGPDPAAPELRRAVRRDAGQGVLAWPPPGEIGIPDCRPCTEPPLPGADTRCCRRVRSYRVTFRDRANPRVRLPVLPVATAAELSGFFVGQKVTLRVEGDRATVLEKEPRPPAPPGKCWHCP